MAGGDEADVDLADADRLAIGDRLARSARRSGAHDRQRLGRRPHLAVAAAGMVGMAVGDQRARLGLRGVDPGVGRAHVDAFGKGSIQEPRRAIASYSERECRAVPADVETDAWTKSLWGLMNIVGPVILLIAADLAGHALAAAGPARRPTRPRRPSRRRDRLYDEEEQRRREGTDDL